MNHRLRSCLLFLSLLSLQEAYSQLTLFAGPQVTTARYRIRGVEQATESKTGFMAGAGLTARFEGTFYFAPQVYYSKKGYRVTYDRPAYPPDSAARNNDVSLHTIEVAPLFQINLSKKPSYLFIRFGPSFDINLSGTERFDTASGRSITRKMPFDFGAYSFATTLLHGHLGFQHRSGFTVVAQYVYGIGSLNNADNGPHIYHQVVGLSLGWRLGRK